MSTTSVHRAPVNSARRPAGEDRSEGRSRGRPSTSLAAVPEFPPAPLPIFSAGTSQRTAPAPTATVLVEVGVTGSGALETATRLAGRIRDLLDADQPAGADLSTSVGVRLGAAAVGVRSPHDVDVPTTGAPAPEAADGGLLRLYPERRVALIDGAALTLTRREFDLLQFLSEHPGRVFGRPQLLRLVWGHQVICGERTVDVHVRRLRAKLGGAGPMIATVRGIGYRLDAVERVTVIGAAD
jgi:two-component system OmpR family response regulator